MSVGLNDMKDPNVMIGNNIYDALAEHGKKPEEVAVVLGKPVRYVKELLDGKYLIKGYELKQIADYLNVPLSDFVDISRQYAKHTGIENLMDKVESEEAKEAIRIADEISDMILFHRRVRENSIRMMNLI